VLLADQVIGTGTRARILAASRRSDGSPVAVKLVSALVDDGPRGVGLELDAVLETLHEVRLLRQLAGAPCVIQVRPSRTWPIDTSSPVTHNLVLF
jgi:hypothetical protein